MGYDLHITRKVNWFDASPSITLDDWLEYVANDPEGWNRRACASGKNIHPAKIGKTPHVFGGAEATSLSKILIKKSGGKCGLSPNLSKPKSREKRENIMAVMARAS
ncbi:hypothetical protein [Rhizobium sp. 10PS4]|uniref:hypothetical protein n=1 Tax=Rhizobium sp. 10PS4 TaxID=3075621 RepID=UPI0028FDA148|nr:hypothetical protein [Rhizobium sp. 10PS4]MDU0308687.1 hypothetical protein [Rhizobium sp. 10PS4]